MQENMTDEEFRTFFTRYPDGAPVRELIRYALKVRALVGGKPGLEDIVEVGGLREYSGQILGTYGTDPSEF